MPLLCGAGNGSAEVKLLLARSAVDLNSTDGNDSMLKESNSPKITQHNDDLALNSFRKGVGGP
jgi:hypothetical protein